MARSHDIDMLHGPLAPKIITFALPVAASGSLQQLFKAADVAVVGQFAGSEALATLLSNAVSSLALVELLRREEGAYHLSLRRLAVNRESLVSIVRIGLPEGVSRRRFALAQRRSRRIRGFLPKATAVRPCPHDRMELDHNHFGGR